MFPRLEKLERIGCLQLLLLLLDGPVHITGMIRRGQGENGIATQNAMKATRRALAEMGLVEEYEEDVPLTRTRRIYVRLTPMGRRVAEHLKSIAEILSET